MRNKPLGVVINDVHYNLHTLKLADAAMRQAIAKANILHVPLVVAGDLHDTKALLRGECVNAMIETFKLCNLKPFVITGNHCKVNEKSSEHSLNFLAPYANVINELEPEARFEAYLIPYYHDPDALRAYLRTLPSGSRLIMHQGVQGSNSGDYIQDRSALNTEDFRDFRVISGHYHTRQDIQCGQARPNKVGTFTYTGNPYTLSFGEANDPPKGFNILYTDGSLEFVPTNLRKHVIWDSKVNDLNHINTAAYKEGDLLWVKVRGAKEELQKLTKKSIAAQFNISENFKLDFIVDKTNTEVSDKTLVKGALLDHLIDNMDASVEQKARLKTLWKGI